MSQGKSSQIAQVDALQFSQLLQRYLQNFHLKDALIFSIEERE
jgi:hypothetical protein